MNQSMVLGPLALPVAFLVFACAVAAGWWVAERLARGGTPRIEPALYLVLACGLAAARLAFVFAYRDAYAAAPLSVLDVRDGGWMPLAGFAGAALAAIAMAAWRACYRKPLAAAWAVAGTLWLAGSGLASLLQPAATPLPALTLSSLEGAPVALARFQGRPVVVNLWATWCPPCRREMPVLQAAQQRYPGATFVFLNQGESAARVQSFLAANRLVLRNVLLDAHGQAGDLLGTRALPATFFFDARGQLLARRSGELSPATLAEMLDGHPLPQSSNP